MTANMLGLVAALLAAGIALYLLRPRPDPRLRHPSTGGAGRAEPTSHVRLLDPDREAGQ